MTTQITRPGTTPAEYARSSDSGGLLIYAATLLSVLGLFNLLDGIAAISHSNVFVANAHYVIGDLRAWGIVIVVIGSLQLVSAAGVVTRNQAARWFGVAALGANAVAQMFFIPSYPFWSMIIIAVDIVGLYALCAYGGKD